MPNPFAQSLHASVLSSIEDYAQRTQDIFREKERLVLDSCQRSLATIEQVTKKSMHRQYERLLSHEDCHAQIKQLSSELAYYKRHAEEVSDENAKFKKEADAMKREMELMKDEKEMMAEELAQSHIRIKQLKKVEEEERPKWDPSTSVKPPAVVLSIKTIDDFEKKEEGPYLKLDQVLIEREHMWNNAQTQQSESIEEYKNKTKPYVQALRAIIAQEKRVQKSDNAQKLCNILLKCLHDLEIDPEKWLESQSAANSLKFTQHILHDKELLEQMVFILETEIVDTKNKEFFDHLQLRIQQKSKRPNSSFTTKKRDSLLPKSRPFSAIPNRQCKLLTGRPTSAFSREPMFSTKVAGSAAQIKRRN